MKRLLWHIFFWVSYFSVCIFNDLYLSESFSRHPGWDLFLEIFWSQFLLLLVKIVTVYFILYYIIPVWISSKSKIALSLFAIASIFAGALFMRVMVHAIIWPFITHNNPPNLDFLRLLARYFYSLLDLVQIAGVAAAIKLYKLRMNAVKNEKTLLQEKLRSEIQHLKSQVNPHFLFNALNSIYALSRSNSVQTPDAVMRLSGIMRYMLYEAGTSTVSLSKELKVIDDYIQLQTLRFGERIKVEIVKSIDHEQEEIASLLLLPLIENAYKHGNDINAVIKIELTVKEKKLNLIISNPVSGSSVNEDQNGIGLKNIERQLQLLYRKHSLYFKNNNEIFSLHLFIDLETFSQNELFDHRR
jgi:two-component system, LytTR family, sensor kinase